MNIKMRYRTLFFVLLVICLGILTPCGRAYAQGEKLVFSNPAGVVGDTVSVTLEIKEEIAAIDLYLSYHEEDLEYVSAESGTPNFTDSGGAGSVHLTDYYTEGQGSFSCTLTFRALEAGSTQIFVTHCDASDGLGEILPVSCESSVITIRESEISSSEADLQNLIVSPGTLSPAFSPETIQYTVPVENRTQMLVISAEPKDNKAVTQVSGNKELKPGVNTVTVTVTAEDGTTKVYALNVTKAENNTASLTDIINGIPRIFQFPLAIQKLQEAAGIQALPVEEEVDATLVPSSVYEESIVETPNDAEVIEEMEAIASKGGVPVWIFGGVGIVILISLIVWFIMRNKKQGEK